MNEVVSFRITRRTRADKCPYCLQRHYPPLSYYYALYAWLAGWVK